MNARGSRAVGRTGRAYTWGRLALMLAGVTVAWYLLAEFVLWGAARAANAQPPAFAWFAFLALALGTLITGIGSVVLGLVGRGQGRAGTGALLGLLGLVVLVLFLFLAIPRIEG